MLDPSQLGVLDAAALLRSRELSAVELLAACEAAIEARNGGRPTFDGEPDAVNAWIRLYPEQAVAHARAADERLAREGDAAPLLCGIPIGLKDLFAVGGLPLTASSHMLDGNVAAADCTAWARLASHGMVLVGHTHTHEFAAGTSTDQVGNPLAPERSAGGSSGGSAAALAAGMVPAALGTDTGGSLRIPAAFCGVSSIKPTHGRVPIDGVVPLASSLDHVGPMARSVADCSALLRALAAGGAQTTPLMPPPASLDDLPTTPRVGPHPMRGLRVALTDRNHAVELDADVGDGLERARDACTRLGAHVIETAAPRAGSSEHFRTIMFSEVATHHARYAEHGDLYRASTREFVTYSARYHGAADYIRAQASAARATVAWEAWFAEHRIDVVLEPTVPTIAHRRGHGYDSGRLGDQAEPVSVFTLTWNLTGFPVVALPAGRGTRSNLPVGVSLVAPRGRESELLQAAISMQAHALPADVGGFHR